MDTNKNVQINTFSGGMDTDSSDSFVKSNTYRFAKNLRFIADSTGSSGEMHSILGTKPVLIYDLNGNEVKYTRILSTDVIRLYTIIVFEYETITELLHTTINTYNWNVFRINNDSIEETEDSIKLYGRLIFGPCTERINSDINTVIKFDKPDNAKIYIVDGEHGLMSININLKDNLDNNIDNTVMDVESVSTLSKNDELSITASTSENAESGTLLACGAYLYFYYLYNNDGVHSPASRLSNIIFAKKIDTQTGRRGSSGETSDTSVTLTLNFSSTAYNSIRIFRIHYNEDGTYNVKKYYELTAQNNNNEPTSITPSYIGVLEDKGINEEDNNVESGIINLLGADSLKKYKYIESFGGYLFGANVLDSIGLNSEALNFFKNEFKPNCTDTQKQKLFNDNLDLSKAYNVQVWGSINIEQQLSQYCSYKFTTYGFIGGSQHETTIQHDEIYRYGVILYDKYGTEWPVKWIADLRTPDFKTSGFKKLRIKFKITLNPRFSDYFTQYEIVRCKRTPNDRATIAQGIVGNVYEEFHYSSTYFSYFLDHEGDTIPETQGISENKLCPTGYMTLTPMLTTSRMYSQEANGTSWINKFARTSTEYFTFACPELCYGTGEDFKSKLDTYENDLYLQPVLQFTLHNMPANDPYDFGNLRIIDRWRSNASDDMSFSSALFTCYNNNSTYWHTNLYKDSKLIYLPRIYSIMTYSNDGPYFGSTVGHETINGSRYLRYCHAVQTASDFNAICNPDSFKNIDLYAKFGLKITDKQVFDNSTEDHNTLFIDNDTNNLTFRNSAKSINNKLFIPWTAPLMLSEFFDESGIYDTFYDYSTPPDLDRAHSVWAGHVYYPIGFANKFVVLKTDGRFSTDNNIENKFGITVCNLRRKKINLYGGISPQSSTYYSFGAVEKIGLWTEDQGDFFMSWFYYNTTATWSNLIIPYTPTLSSFCQCPIESLINMVYDKGKTIVRNNWDTRTNTYGRNCRSYVQGGFSYLYDKIYSTIPDAKSHNTTTDNSLNRTSNDCRIIWSNPQDSDSSEDPWLTFNDGLVIDVDSRYGAITGLKSFGNQLLFFQEKAVGILSVNEKTILSNSNEDSNVANIVLGNTEVLQRYDYLSKIYGMKDRTFTDTQSANALYWWDDDNQEILKYSNREGITPLTKTKNIRKFINSLDTQNSCKSAFNLNYSEILFSFANNNTLVFNELLDTFTGVYDIDLNKSFRFNNNFYITTSDRSKIYLFDSLTNGQNLIHGENIETLLKFVVNDNPSILKIYDNIELGVNTNLLHCSILFANKIGNYNSCIDVDENDITNREFVYEAAVPRKDNAVFADRMRGKTLDIQIDSDNHINLFSLAYFKTKYRALWS